MGCYGVFKLKNGLIIALNQQDTIISKDKRIDVLPAYKFLTSEQVDK